jgi:hypothetical protein
VSGSGNEGASSVKILYVAKHDQVETSNDDEGAVAHAFRELGHEVVCVHEMVRLPIDWRGFDFLLFHKWDNYPEIHRLSRQLPLVFWYFDLVDHPDPMLRRRCSIRRQWMEAVVPNVRTGFCTDGDWVAADKTSKLCWLSQGADGRMVGKGKPIPLPTGRVPILFTGISKGGTQRQSFVDEMANRYASNFLQVHSGAYGKRLGDLIATADIVVAPDGPVTDRYWSNRVYLTLGYCGFLLHPYCKGLVEQYTDGGELVYYHSREELHDQISRYLSLPFYREEIAAQGFERTQRGHLYRHRVEEMLGVLKERGIV